MQLLDIYGDISLSGFGRSTHPIRREIRHKFGLHWYLPVLIPNTAIRCVNLICIRRLNIANAMTLQLPNVSRCSFIRAHRCGRRSPSGQTLCEAIKPGGRDEEAAHEITHNRAQHQPSRAGAPTKPLPNAPAFPLQKWFRCFRRVAASFGAGLALKLLLDRLWRYCIDEAAKVGLSSFSAVNLSYAEMELIYFAGRSMNPCGDGTNKLASCSLYTAIYFPGLCFDAGAGGLLPPVFVFIMLQCHETAWHRPAPTIRGDLPTFSDELQHSFGTPLYLERKRMARHIPMTSSVAGHINTDHLCNARLLAG